MKKTLFGIIIGLYSINLSAQDNKAIMEINYETKMISDSLNRDKVNIFSTALLFNNTQSIYCSKEAKLYYKGTPAETITTSAGQIAKYPKTVESIYKNNDVITASLPVGKYAFTFEEPKLKWEILSDRKEIKGYKSQLAKTITDTGQIFFAWFTTDITIPEGPFRFKGLSGLVLEVYNKNRTIEIYATDIKKSNELIEPLKYYNEVKAKTKAQFLEARKNYHENPSIYNGNMRLFDEYGNEKTKMMTDRIKSITTFLD
ncbi:GLPGLI family protein [Chryseobacterium sp. RP-3-3]|uniref:GLPGLI family protein n=1 Tax=Chryseobacterium antibioticum TaxID=2728847 RepID=A0A7Y0AML6_9FLAO|nr:GLPGLI family protein [Chryseobacterium antibioticum]NML70090.1 GLPGLI family protein [Chryseobacterium antibioticum]